MAINSLHPVTIVQLPLWAILNYLKCHDTSTTCTQPTIAISLNTATFGIKLPLSNYSFVLLGIFFSLFVLENRVFQLRGTYNNYLLQLLYQFWADQVKALFNSNVQKPLKHWQAWGIHHLPRVPVPVFEEILPNVQSEPALEQFWTIPTSPISGS